MDSLRSLEQSVTQARRRLWVDRAIAAWPWCAGGALLVAAAAVVVDRIRPVGLALPALVWTATVGSVLAALGWAWLRRGDRLAAAVELDRRCGLDERVSSAIALGSAGANVSLAAAAVRIDAERRLATVDVAAAFPSAVSRRWARPLVPGVAALAAALLLTPPRHATNPNDPAIAPSHVADATKALEGKFAEKKQAAESLKLTEARRLLEKLETETAKLSADPRLDPKETLITLNDLAKQLEERRRAIEVPDAIPKQLSKLRTKERGPADDLARSLRRGDFLFGIEQVDALHEQLESNRLDASKREQLAKQLDELSKQFDPSVEASARRESPAESKESSVNKLQQALRSAAGGLQDGRDVAAKSALDELKKQIQALAAQQAEMQLLDEGLFDLAECKSGLRRGDEPGPGQTTAPGQDPGEVKGLGEAGSDRDGESGGLKPGVGTARRESPTVEDEQHLFDARVRTELGDAALRVVGPTDGPNAKGRALQAIREQAAALAEGAPSQPIVNQPLDRSRRAQKRQYFEALRP